MPVDNFDDNIQWSSFKTLQVRPGGKDADAKTSADYRAEDITPVRKGKAIIVKAAKVSISMDSNGSWVLNGKADADLLKHEQGHYDITALGARDYYNLLFTVSAANMADFKKKVDALNQRMESKIHDVNVRYDAQTNHSRIKTAQDQWNKAIATEKQKLDGSIDNLP